MERMSATIVRNYTKLKFISGLNVNWCLYSFQDQLTSKAYARLQYYCGTISILAVGFG